MRLRTLKNNNLNVDSDRSKSSSDMRMQTVNLVVKKLDPPRLVKGTPDIPSNDEKNTDPANTAERRSIHCESIAPREGTHPTSICRGKNPMREPIRRAPKRKNARPVREFSLC